MFGLGPHVSPLPPRAYNHSAGLSSSPLPHTGTETGTATAKTSKPIVHVCSSSGPLRKPSQRQRLWRPCQPTSQPGALRGWGEGPSSVDAFLGGIPGEHRKQKQKYCSGNNQVGAFPLETPNWGRPRLSLPRYVVGVRTDVSNFPTPAAFVTL